MAQRVSFTYKKRQSNTKNKIPPQKPKHVSIFSENSSTNQTQLEVISPHNTNQKNQNSFRYQHNNSKMTFDTQENLMNMMTLTDTDISSPSNMMLSKQSGYGFKKSSRPKIRITNNNNNNYNSSKNQNNFNLGAKSSFEYLDPEIINTESNLETEKTQRNISTALNPKRIQIKPNNNNKNNDIKNKNKQLNQDKIQKQFNNMLVKEQIQEEHSLNNYPIVTSKLDNSKQSSDEGQMNKSKAIVRIRKKNHHEYIARFENFLIKIQNIKTYEKFQIIFQVLMILYAALIFSSNYLNKPELPQMTLVILGLFCFTDIIETIKDMYCFITVKKVLFDLNNINSDSRISEEDILIYQAIETAFFQYNSYGSYILGWFTMHKIVKLKNKYMLIIKEINIVLCSILYLFCVERILVIREEYKSQNTPTEYFKHNLNNFLLIIYLLLQMAEPIFLFLQQLVFIFINCVKDCCNHKENKKILQEQKIKEKKQQDNQQNHDWKMYTQDENRRPSLLSNQQQPNNTRRASQIIQDSEQFAIQQQRRRSTLILQQNGQSPLRNLQYSPQRKIKIMVPLK